MLSWLQAKSLHVAGLVLLGTTGAGAVLFAMGSAEGRFPPVPETHPRRVVANETLSTARPQRTSATSRSAQSASDRESGDSGAASVALTTRPRPHPLMGKAELAFRTHLYDAIAEMAATRPSARDAEHLRAIRDIARRPTASNDPGAEIDALVAKIVDPVGRKLGRWLKYRIGAAAPDEMKRFLVENPLWPSRRRIRRKLEDAAFTKGGTVGEIKALFEGLPPTTGPGMAAFASAQLALKQSDTATALVAKAWREDLIPVDLETGFFERFGKLLTGEDHLRRIDWLLSDRPSKRAQRKRRADKIRRMRALVTKDEEQLTTARLSVYLGQRAAADFLKELSPAARKDKRLARQLAQRARRASQYRQAAEYLRGVPAGQASVHPDADWQLRRRIAVELVDAGKFALAYDTVAKAHPRDINRRKDAAFLAGWIALRKLNKPRQALVHFKAMLEAADGPLSASKAHYWLGRVHQVLGDADAAGRAFATGGGYLDTFHGALSRLSGKQPDRALVVPMPPKPSPEEIASFKGRDVVRAAVLARHAKLPDYFVRLLIGHFTWRVKPGGEILLAAALGEALGETQIAVRAGKAGVSRGHPHYIYGYPVHRLATFEPLTPPPPKPLILAIARQESEFKTSIVSHAGARGILQVMPITARDVCRIYKTQCDIPRLLTDEAYNTRMGAAYISRQMQVVDNNLILTLTSYNAGPGRTRQWLRQRGDPRSTKYDALDWAYQIPFRETRLYVQKVLSNMQVYRARLGERAPVRLDQDLGIAPGSYR